MFRIKQKGFTMFELVTTFPLYVIIGLVLTMSLVHFAVQYNETQDFITLQNDLFSTIENLRAGYVDKSYVKNPSTRMPMMGITSADSVFFSHDGSITIAPKKFDRNTSEFSTFKFNSGTGELLVSGRNYSRNANNALPETYNNVRLFPKSDEKIGKDYKYKMLSFDASSANPAYYSFENKTWLVGLKVKAMVRFRKKGKGQSASEDLIQNTRTISYKTKVFLGNID